MATKTEFPEAAAELAHEVAEWRRTRAKIGRMPAELWARSVELAQEYGTCRVARVVQLDPKALGRRLRKHRGSARRCPPEEAFVELPSAFLDMGGRGKVVAGTDRETHVTVEVSAPDGARMTMTMQGIGGVDVVGLLHAFWRRPSCSR